VQAIFLLREREEIANLTKKKENERKNRKTQLGANKQPAVFVSGVKIFNKRTNLLQISLGTKLSHTGDQTCQTESTGTEPETTEQTTYDAGHSIPLKGQCSAKI